MYSLIIFCREQISYYRKSVLKVFFTQLDVPNIVVNTLYDKLMKDVKALCENHLEELYDVEFWLFYKYIIFIFKFNLNLVIKIKLKLACIGL